MHCSCFKGSRQVVLGVCAVFSACAILADGAGQLVDLPPEIAAASEQYQTCVAAQFSSTESAAAKRQRLAVECAADRASLVGLYPAQMQAWVLGLIDSRLDLILSALEQAESAVTETVSDVEEIVEELAILEAEAGSFETVQQ